MDVVTNEQQQRASSCYVWNPNPTGIPYLLRGKSMLTNQRIGKVYRIDIRQF